jgi:hypothetical protein
VNRQSSLRFAVAFIFAATAFAVLALADFGALAQNSNTSTTGEDSTQNANANTAPTRRGRGRRGRRSAAANANAAADANANTGDATTMPDNRNPTAAAQDEDMMGDLSGERADLSGTYTGHVMMSGGHDMDGEATLTITGNTFQMSGEGMNHGGRVYAVLTRGETSAAFYFSDMTDPTTRTPVVYNVRARKRGDRLTLTPAPNTRARMTFGTAGRRPRPRRGMVTPDANSNTGDNTNTTPPR